MPACNWNELQVLRIVKKKRPRSTRLIVVNVQLNCFHTVYLDRLTGISECHSGYLFAPAGQDPGFWGLDVEVATCDRSSKYTNYLLASIFTCTI